MYSVHILLQTLSVNIWLVREKKKTQKEEDGKCVREREIETAETEGLNDDLLNWIGSYSKSTVLNRYPATILQSCFVSLTRSLVFTGTFHY